MLRTHDGRAGGGEGSLRGVGGGAGGCGGKCSPLCPDQQVEGLHTQVVGAVRPEQDVMQEVEGDVSGRIVARLQQVRQQLQGALGVVLLDGAVDQRQDLMAQLLRRFCSLSLIDTGGGNRTCLPSVVCVVLHDSRRVK